MKIENPTMEQVKNFVNEATRKMKKEASEMFEFGRPVPCAPIDYILRRPSKYYPNEKEFSTPSALYKAVRKSDVIREVYSYWEAGDPFIVLVCQA